MFKYWVPVSAGLILLLVGFAKAGTINTTAAATAKATAEAKAAAPSKVVLEKKNTLAFRDVVSASSVTNLQKAALKMSAQLSKNDVIYLFLDTPGGSIVAGEQLITTLKGLPQEVKTITSFAASMGFITVQSLGERLVLPNGILMSHRAYVGIEGQMPGEFNSQAKFWNEAVEDIEIGMAARMGLPLAEYQKLIHSEYWVKGPKSVKANAADRVVNVSCGSDLNGTYDDSIDTIFGPIKVTWSECPLVTYPVDISFASVYTRDSVEEEKLTRLVRDTYSTKRKIVSDPIHRDMYFRFVR